LGNLRNFNLITPSNKISLAYLPTKESGKGGRGLRFYFIEVFEGEILSQILLSIWAEPENKQKQNWECVGIFIFFKDSLADTGGRGGG